MVRPASEPIVLIITPVTITTVWLKKHLAKNFHVLTETSSEKALEILKNSIIDLVILDENIKDMNFLKLSALIKKNQTPHWIPILLITSNLKKRFKTQAIRSGITDFLYDPLEKNELNQKILRVTQLSEMHQKISSISQTFQSKKSSTIKKTFTKTVKIFSQPKKEKIPLTIALLGIEKFKNFEKQHSIFETEKLLLDISELLIQEIRKNDILIPSKDGKFILIMPQTSLEESEKIVSQLKKNVDKKIFMNKFALHFSIVLTSEIKKGSQKELDRIIKKAEKTLKKNQIRKNP